MYVKKDQERWRMCRKHSECMRARVFVRVCASGGLLWWLIISVWDPERHRPPGAAVHFLMSAHTHGYAHKHTRQLVPPSDVMPNLKIEYSHWFMSAWIVRRHRSHISGLNVRSNITPSHRYSNSLRLFSLLVLRHPENKSKNAVVWQFSS